MVGLVETKDGGIECGLRVGEHGKAVALTVQTVGELVTNLHEVKVERLKVGGDMLNDEELAALLTQAGREHAVDIFVTPPDRSDHSDCGRQDSRTSKEGRLHPGTHDYGIDESRRDATDVL